MQGFPSPSPIAKPGCHDGDEVSHYLKEDDDTNFAAGVMFSVEDRPHIIMQHNSTICVIN